MKTTKKFLSIILAILMIATSIPFAFAADTTLSVGDQFEADLTKQGSDNLTFRYVFKVLSLPDAENEYGKLELVSPAKGVYPTVLKIAMLTPKITYDGVTFEITSIGDRAFTSNFTLEYDPGDELQEVNLMLGTVENIGNEAFANCKKLEIVIFSPNVSKFVIGEHAFDICESITSLHIQANGASSSVEIGQGAFSACTGLKELDLSSSVSKLGLGAFIGCKSLATVTFGGNMLTEIPGWCFAYSEIESIAIPEGVTSITGEAAFYECNSLKSVELPSTMKTVANESGTFYGSPLERVVFKGGETVEFGGGYPLPLLTVENGFGDGLYANGQEITITANEKEGYEFVNWEIAEGDGTLADASAAETTYTMGSSTATLRPVYEDIRTECEKGNHEFVNYVKSAEASCGVNAKETAKCENCEVTDTREIEGSALTHSFSKYEEVEAPKCDVAGKKVAACDNGCDATDEQEIPALEHKFNTEDTASAELTRPVKNADGTYTDGYYTFTCQNENCEETTTVTVKTADYTAFDAAVTQAQELIENTNLCDGPKSSYIARLDAINSSAYSPLRIESEQIEVDGFVGSVNSLIGDIETGIQNGTSIKADFSEMETLFAEISELIGGDTNKITPNNMSLYTEAQNYYNTVKDNGNYSQYNADSAMPGYISQLETLKAGLLDGTMLKADYTQINAVIAAIDEMLQSIDVSAEVKMELANIKTELDSMQLNPTLSQAAFNESGLLEKAEALNKTIGACADGNHEFVTYVKSADASCGVNAKETAKCENCEVTDTREIEGSALTHSFSKYEEVEAPKCDVAGKKVAACDNGCDATDEQEIPALTHSFTKYEEIEAPKCGVAGKKAAVCDNNCGTTDEKEIPALEHIDNDSDYFCDYDCGFAFAAESDGVKTTLDVSKGKIVIADSYVTLGNERVVVDPDGYILTGTAKGDTPLKLINDSGSSITFDLVFDNLSLAADSWCSVIVIEDNSPVTLNIVCEGSNSITSYNHPVFNNSKAQTSITINITKTEGSSLFSERQMHTDKGILFSKDDTNTFVYINGNQVDAAAQCYVHKNIDGIQDCRGYLCDNCGQYFGEADADKHSFTNYEEVEAPKCGVAGKEVAECDNGCGETDEQEIPALEHTPLEAVKENEVAPKCGVAGSYDLVVYCDVCGEELDRDTVAVDALTHEPLEAVKENEVYATCKAEGGYDLVVYCYLCGEEIDSEHITTQKLPHTPSGWWVTTETEHYKHCVNDSCSEEIEGTRAAHTYTWKVTTEATATTDGMETGTCECGYETTRVIPATGETPVPDPEPGTPDVPTDDTCDHLCHKSGFIGFIWKIVRFFWKLFRMNPTCSCGAAHY